MTASCGVRRRRHQFHFPGISFILAACLVPALPAGAEDYAKLLTRGDPVTDYLEAIDEAEIHIGPYAMEMADLYLGLGRSLASTGELDDAMRAYQQGAHVVRVNDGLYSAQQTSFLFPVAEILDQQGDWETARETMEYIYRINDEHYDGLSLEMLPILERILDWYQPRGQALTPQMQFENMHLQEKYANHIAMINEQLKGPDHPDTRAMYRRIGQMHYETLYHEQQVGRMPIDRKLVMANGMHPSSHITKDYSRRSHINAGTEAFRKAAESFEHDSGAEPLLHAEALAQLGDWYLSTNKKQDAAEAYRQAYEALADNEATAYAADAYFIDPVPVRFMHRDLWPVDGAGPGDDGPWVRVSMGVTRAGEARDVEIVETPEDMTRQQAQEVASMLGHMRYRPRLVAGSPEVTHEMIWSFPVGHQ